MNSSWQTFGHNRIKNILNKQLESAKLPHAYLFVGPEGLGKKTLALEFAQKVLQTERLSNHPDFELLDAEGEITMEQTLVFISRLGLMPFVAGKKIALINNAQNLNIQSSNALLKTLEEPSPSTVIILVATGGILPTITSRCQVLSFSPFAKSELKEFAARENITFSDRLAEMSFGSLGRLKALAGQPEFLQIEQQAIEEYETAVKSTLSQKFISINNLAELELQQLRQRLLTWLFWQRHKLKNAPEDYTKVRALNDSINNLAKNQNKKLVLQSLMLKI